jgi:hypothetical protein
MGEMRNIVLTSGDAFAVEHVHGFVTSVWPGKAGASWVEVRQRDGRDRLCRLLVPLPLEEEQVDEVSLALGGKAGDTALAWRLWRSGVRGAPPGLLAAACGARRRSRADPGLVGSLMHKLLARLPRKAANLEAELAGKLHALLDVRRAAA